METETYIVAYIFKNSSDNYDCSLDGISNNYTEVFVPVKNGNYTLQQALKNYKKIPILKLGITGDRTHLMPNIHPETKHFAFGGCFVYSSDSRFNRSISKRPIHLHDRDMGKENR